MLRTFPIIFVLCGVLIEPIKCASELLDVSCNDGADCSGFEVASLNIKSFCIDRQCLCTNGSSSLSLPCVPREEATRNQVGKACPCDGIPYATCSQGVCICVTNFAASADKRRCLPKFVPIGERCEYSAQCTSTSSFSVCHAASRRCECWPGHALGSNNECQGLVAIGYNCTTDTDCAQRVPHTICQKGGCMCDPDFAALNDTHCVVNRRMHESCHWSVQCQHELGLGGHCNRLQSIMPSDSANNGTAAVVLLPEGRCGCDDLQYVPVGIRAGNMTYKCENRKAIGDPCADDRDCHQLRELPADELPPLECFAKECICSATNGYEPLDRYCIKRNDASGSSAALWLPVVVAVTLGLANSLVSLRIV